MSIATVVTEGFGSFGSTSFVVTSGYSILEAVASYIIGQPSIRLSMEGGPLIQTSIGAGSPLLQPSIKGTSSIN